MHKVIRSVHRQHPRQKIGSDSRIYLSVILFLGLLGIAVLIALLVLNVQYESEKKDLTARLENSNEKLEQVELDGKFKQKNEELEKHQSVLKQNVTKIQNNLNECNKEGDRLRFELEKLKNSTKCETGVLHDKAANFSVIKNNLTEPLEASDYDYSMNDENEYLESNPTEMTNQQNSFQSVSTQNQICPAGWMMFSFSCYFLSKDEQSWDGGRDDCRNRSADLVVVDNAEEQEFLNNIIWNDTWIGLNDKENEGSWQWVDGTPLNHSLTEFWEMDQPDNGNDDPKYGEEDCGHIRTDYMKWNDISCARVLPWICEKNIT